MVQQATMLLFDSGINTEIFCDIKDATCESIRSCKQEAQLLQRDRATYIVSLNLDNCC